MILTVCLALACITPAPSCAGDPRSDIRPFQQLMALASVKRLLVVDTVAGKTRVFFASSTVDPRLVVVHAMGGGGNPAFEEKDGLPVTKRGGNPMYFFGVAFLKKKVAWAAVDVPAEFGSDLQTFDRLTDRHIESFAQAARQVRIAYPKARIILMGHSNGGITAAMQSVLSKPAFDGIVLASPNLKNMPYDWEPTQAKVPIMFITHEQDHCAATHSSQTILLAGKIFPVTVITTPSTGPDTECRYAPAPHFFSHVQEEMADAVIRWANQLCLKKTQRIRTPVGQPAVAE